MASQNGQPNVEETDNNGSSEEIVKREMFDGTPFTGISLNGGESWFLTMGKYRVTDDGNTLDELWELVIDRNWELMMNCISAVVTETLKVKEN